MALSARIGVFEFSETRYGWRSWKPAGGRLACSSCIRSVRSTRLRKSGPMRWCGRLRPSFPSC
jgi:hypothetical protein